MFEDIFFHKHIFSVHYSNTGAIIFKSVFCDIRNCLKT